MCAYVYTQDSSGWTPLMIAASLRDADDIVDLLLNKEADVNAKSKSHFMQEPVYFALSLFLFFLFQTHFHYEEG